MRKLLSVLFFALSITANAQVPNINIGASEYLPLYQGNDSTMYGTFGYGTRTIQQVSTVKMKYVHGGQYHTLTGNDTAAYKISYNLGTALPDIIVYNRDSRGLPFTQIQAVHAFFETEFLIHKDTPYVFGQDRLSVNGGTVITQPIRLNVPAGVKIVKLCNGYDFGPVYALGDNGNIYKYDYGGGLTPSAVYTGGGIVDLTCLSDRALVAFKTNDILAMGVDLSWINVGTNYGSLTSIRSSGTWASIPLPIKEVQGSLKAIHIIDAQDSCWGVGDKMAGGIGNGTDTTWNTYRPWFNWDGNKTTVVGPVKLWGKWKNLRSTNNLAYQYYLQEYNTNEWYVFGRNKNFVTASHLEATNDDQYPNWRTFKYPFRVGTSGHPTQVTWPASEGLTVDTLGTAVTIDGGASQNISGTSSTLTATASGGTIIAYHWTQIGGPARATMATTYSPSSGSTSITGMSTAGKYLFYVEATNSAGKYNGDTVSIVKAGTNVNPTVNISSTLRSRQPVYVDLNMTATDADGFISSVTMVKQSGAGTPTITALPNSGSSYPFRITGVSPGTYVFRFTATDNSAGSSTYDVTVTVLGPVVKRPRIVVTKNF